MPQIINTNIASLNAQRNLDRSQSAQETALQRLSSGLRINSAKDDAAGIAIANRLDAQVRGLSVASRNAGDGVSLAQIAEGSIESIASNLQRIRELAVQASNATNGVSERAALNDEAQQLIDEIERTSSSASFNGVTLLDGSFQGKSFQVGANVGDEVNISLNSVGTDTLGSVASVGVSSNNAVTALTAEQTITAGDLVINGTAVGAPLGSDDTASFALQGSSAIAKAAAINKVSDASGVIATVSENAVMGSSIAAGTATAVAAEAVLINGVSITLSVAAVETEAALNAVADTINTKSDLSGVSASVVATSTGFRVDLTSADGRNITVDTTTGGSEDFGLADDGTDGTAVTFVGNFTLSSADRSDIKISTNTASIDNFGLEEGTFSGSRATLVGDSSNGSGRAALVAGDVTINGLSVGATKAADDTASSIDNSKSSISLAAAINTISSDTGVTATALENNLYSAALGTTGGAFALVINGTAIAGTTVAGAANTAANLQTIIDAVNAKSGLTGVTAEALDSDQYTLTAADGRNLQVVTTTAGDTGLTAGVYVGGVALEGGGIIELGSLTGSIGSAGLRTGNYAATESGSLLKDVDISTAAGAKTAITSIDNALTAVNSERAKLGSIQIRFENVISANAIAIENFSASASRIKDADFASETAALSRAQVLQQAGISVLAQANAQPQQVLSLLQ